MWNDFRFSCSKLPNRGSGLGPGGSFLLWSKLVKNTYRRSRIPTVPSRIVVLLSCRKRFSITASKPHLQQRDVRVLGWSFVLMWLDTSAYISPELSSQSSTVQLIGLQVSRPTRFTLAWSCDLWVWLLAQKGIYILLHITYLFLPFQFSRKFPH